MQVFESYLLYLYIDREEFILTCKYRINWFASSMSIAIKSFASLVIFSSDSFGRSYLLGIGLRPSVLVHNVTLYCGSIAVIVVLANLDLYTLLLILPPFRQIVVNIFAVNEVKETMKMLLVEVDLQSTFHTYILILYTVCYNKKVLLKLIAITIAFVVACVNNVTR